MKIRLTQLDGKLPNLALMKLSYWHKSKGDEVYFKQSVTKDVFEPDYDIVYGSTIFTSSAKKVGIFKQQFPNAVIGGTGYDMKIKVETLIGCGDYEYENYDYSIYPDFKHSIGFTQRGCRLRCSFCVVPQKEGKMAVVNPINKIWREGTERKLHLLDNDFFGQPAWKERSQEIIDGKFKVCFNQGINVRLIHKEGAEMLAKMKYMDDQFKTKRIYTAWDNRRDEHIFMKGIKIMTDAGIKHNQILVYMLCGYWEGETFDDIYYRFERMKDMGIMPYPMIHADAKNYKELKKFQRWVVRRYYQFTPWEIFKNENEADYYRRVNRNRLTLFDDFFDNN
jgi:hypothetical protein